MDLSKFSIDIKGKTVLGLRSQKAPTCAKYGCFMAEKKDMDYNVSIYSEGIIFTAEYTEEKLKKYIAMLLENDWLWMVHYDLQALC